MSMKQMFIEAKVNAIFGAKNVMNGAQVYFNLDSFTLWWCSVLTPLSENEVCVIENVGDSDDYRLGDSHKQDVIQWFMEDNDMSQWPETCDVICNALNDYYNEQDLYDMARQRIFNSDTLKDCSEFILADWNEGGEHWAWVVIEEEERILEWVKAG